jgi:hypothetical protein
MDKIIVKKAIKSFCPLPFLLLLLVYVILIYKLLL